MHYLVFDLSEDAEGVTSLEAMAATAVDQTDQHAAVMVEVHRVLGWAWQHYPHSHGPVDDGMDWDHDLQVQIEDHRWHVVNLTLAGSPRFVEAFLAAFGATED